MLRIVTDGAVDLPASWYKEFDINRIPINIHFGEKTYLQDVDLDQDGFYKLVAQGNLPHPKTSQPSPHQFVEYYKKIAQQGDTILSIHITSKLSGTYASSALTPATRAAAWEPYSSATESTARRAAVIPFSWRRSRCSRTAWGSMRSVCSSATSFRC